MDEVTTIHTDGASRGNPGAAAWAFVLRRPGADPVEIAAKLGSTTNNVAEYTALVKALEHAKLLGVRRLQVYTDSELMVKQMSGVYAVKSADLRGLFDTAQHLRRGFESVRVDHVRRAENKRADELCNAVLDGRPPECRDGKAAKVAASPKSAASRPVRSASVDADAIACLNAAAKEWAKDGGTRLTADQVWKQLWSVLEDGGVLRKAKKR